MVGEGGRGRMLEGRNAVAEERDINANGSGSQEKRGLKAEG